MGKRPLEGEASGSSTTSAQPLECSFTGSTATRGLIRRTKARLTSARYKAGSLHRRWTRWCRKLGMSRDLNTTDVVLGDRAPIWRHVLPWPSSRVNGRRHINPSLGTPHEDGKVVTTARVNVRTPEDWTVSSLGGLALHLVPLTILCGVEDGDGRTVLFLSREQLCLAIIGRDGKPWQATLFPFRQVSATFLRGTEENRFGR